MTNKYMYFVANWKMYGNLSSLNTLDKVIKFSKSKEIKKGRLIYCPPYTLISSFSKKFKNCQIAIGGQNCHENESLWCTHRLCKFSYVEKYWCSFCNYWTFRK